MQGLLLSTTVYARFAGLQALGESPVSGSLLAVGALGLASIVFLLCVVLWVANRL